MHKLNNISKILLTITLIFGSIWLGGYIARHLVIYQFFDPDNFKFLDIYNNPTSQNSIRLIQSLLVLNIITYSIFFISLLLFIIISRVSFKRNGWLFICIVIVLITAPFEIFLLTIDYEILLQIMNNNFDTLKVLTLIQKRIEILSSFSIIEIFSYISMYFLIIFKPLTKLNEN